MSKKNSSKIKVIPAEKRFYNNLSELLDLLNSVIKNLDNNVLENIGLNIANVYISGREKSYLVIKFAKSHRQWPSILNKDKEYFLKNGLTLIKTKNKQIKKILKSSIKKILSENMNPEVEERFWRLLHGLVRTSIHFLYSNPLSVPKHFGWTVEDIAKLWNVELGLIVYSNGDTEIVKADQGGEKI